MGDVAEKNQRISREFDIARAKRSTSDEQLNELWKGVRDANEGNDHLGLEEIAFAGKPLDVLRSMAGDAGSVFAFDGLADYRVRLVDFLKNRFEVSRGNFDDLIKQGVDITEKSWNISEINRFKGIVSGLFMIRANLFGSKDEILNGFKGAEQLLAGCEKRIVELEARARAKVKEDLREMSLVVMRLVSEEIKDQVGMEKMFAEYIDEEALVPFEEGVHGFAENLIYMSMFDLVITDGLPSRFSYEALQATSLMDDSQMESFLKECLRLGVIKESPTEIELDDKTTYYWVSADLVKKLYSFFS